MKAAVLRGHDHPFVIEDVTLGPLRANEVLVRVVGTGLCHTDLLLRNPALGARVAPAILGHEGAGIVADVGVAVTRVKLGDHVLISFDSCGTCASCLRGAPAYCIEFERRNLSGRRADGTASATSSSTGGEVANRWFGQSSFAELSIATERNLVMVDPSLPLEKLGPLGCGIQTGAGSVLVEMRMAAGQTIAIFGVGVVGLAAVMAAKIAGAREIVAVDLNPARREMARELGATRVVDGGHPQLQAEVVGNGPGMDFSLDTTAVSAVMSTAISVLARPGKAVLVGVGSGTLQVAPNMLAGKYVTFAYEGSCVPQLFLPQLIDYWQRGLFPFDKLLQMYPLSQINQAERDSNSGVTIKAVLIPD